MAYFDDEPNGAQRLAAEDAGKDEMSQAVTSACRSAPFTVRDLPSPGRSVPSPGRSVPLTDDQRLTWLGAVLAVTLSRVDVDHDSGACTLHFDDPAPILRSMASGAQDLGGLFIAVEQARAAVAAVVSGAGPPEA